PARCLRTCLALGAGLAVAAGLAPGARAAVAAPAAPKEMPEFERARARIMLKVVRDDLEKFYYDPGFHGVSLDEAFGAASDKIDKAGSVSQLFAAIARPYLQLKDSHTVFIPPGRSVKVHFGWQMQVFGDKCYVTAVQPGSDAAAKGLKPGDQILSIDGNKPTREGLHGINYVYRAIAPRPSFSLGVLSPGGAPRTVEINARIEQLKKVLDLTRASDVEDFIHDLEEEAHRGRHIFVDYGPQLVVWRMPEFNLSPAEVANEMRRIRDHQAAVLDLRGNPGGAVETLERMIGAFMDEGVSIGDVKSRADIKPVVSKKAGEVYTGKIVVLVDSESASCAELMARTIQMGGRGHVVGDRTAGAVMMSMSHSHMVGDSSGAPFVNSITVADIIMKDGKSLEKNGVTPDTILLPTAEDLAAGRDPVLSHAASLLGVTILPDKAGALFPVEWEK
ncbi:MAG TPA: S41 family peptidase, partial [Candidatus Polarisedimenticolia bacterium]|nr:S41 family peptidase [Candidatus Polarisedimenticolia bacterium]